MLFTQNLKKIQQQIILEPIIGKRKEKKSDLPTPIE